MQIKQQTPSVIKKSDKSKNIYDVFNKELNQKTTLPDGSKITKLEALVRQIIDDALENGDNKKLSFIFKILEKSKVHNTDQELMDKLINDKVVSKKDIIDYLNGNKPCLFNNGNPNEQSVMKNARTIVNRILRREDSESSSD